MQQPPRDSDPNAFTQPMPVSRPPQPPPGGGAPPGAGPPGGGRPAPYDHRFGNVPSYLLARLLAFIVDIGGIGFVLAAFGYDAFERGLIVFATRDQRGFGWLALAALALALGIKFVFEALAGTTVGKLIFGLHVRTGRGGHAGIGRAFVRNLLLPIDAIGIGPLLALITPRHQRLGDLVAGTVIGRSPIGAFAPVLGIVLAVAIGFAQATFGGGLTSAVGITAEAALFIPQFYSNVTSPGSAIAPLLPGARAATPSPRPFAPPADISPEPADTPQPEESAEPAESPDAGSSPDAEGSPQEAPPQEATPEGRASANV